MSGIDISDVVTSSPNGTQLSESYTAQGDSAGLIPRAKGVIEAPKSRGLASDSLPHWNSRLHIRPCLP